MIYLLKRINNINNQKNSLIKKKEKEILKFFDLDYTLKFGIYYDLINTFKKYFNLNTLNSPINLSNI